MKEDEDRGPITAGLPILDELGEGLRRDHLRREQQRRRHATVGVLFGAIAAIGLTAAMLAGGGPEPARAIEIAAGRAGDASWRLVLIDAEMSPCLDLRPRDDSGSSGACTPGSPSLDRSVARTRLNGQDLVYGFSSPAASPVRLSASGQIELLDDESLSPSKRDPRNRGRGLPRSVSTQPLPPKVRERRLVPGATRVFVAALPSGPAGAVIVEPARPGSSGVVIRIPRTTSR